MLDELGIVHMNGRLYDPELGRVLSGDPIIQEPENAQNYNRYSYVINNPLSLTDPSGYSWWSKNVTKKVSKFVKNVGNTFTKAWKKTTKWLAENEWASIAVTVIVGIVSMGVGLAAVAAWNGVSLGLGGALTALTSTAALSGGMGALIGGGFGSLVMAGAIGGALAGGVNAALAGGDLGDIFKGALIGGIQGGASAGIGHGSWFSAGTLGSTGSAIAQTTAHGILGGAVNEAMGGKFQDGFLSAAAAKGATFLPGVGDYLRPSEGHGNILTRTALAATIGGTASALGGGKFANGAKTAAMQHLFNEEGGTNILSTLKSAAKMQLGHLNNARLYLQDGVGGVLQLSGEIINLPFDYLNIDPMALGPLGGVEMGAVKGLSSAGRMIRMAGRAPKTISTGRTVANSLYDKLAMEQVMSKPMGTTPPRIPAMSDTKNNLMAADGWVKRVQNVNGVEIHYVENINTKQVLDFKFKD
jgi:RHS repeat-associated protein